jgi:hypothetical protein
LAIGFASGRRPTTEGRPRANDQGLTTNDGFLLLAFSVLLLLSSGNSTASFRNGTLSDVVLTGEQVFIADISCQRTGFTGAPIQASPSAR